MKNKQKLLPFNLEEALKNPERVVFTQQDRSILEWVYLEKADVLLAYGKNGDYNEHKNLKKKAQIVSFLSLLPLPDKITKTYQAIVIDENEVVFVDDSFQDTISDIHEWDNSLAIQETAFNHTTGEISIKIVHKY